MKKQRNTIRITLLTGLFALISVGISFAQNDPFITVWKTDFLGSSNADEILVPAKGDWDYYWEEVGTPSNNYTSTTMASDETTISFGQPGTYRLKIIPNNVNNTPFNQIQFSSQGDRRKIIDIEQWGEVQWKSFSEAFYSCINLTCSATDIPDLSQVTSLYFMFGFAYEFNGDVENWDVSNVKNMEGLFNYAYIFNGNLSSWDVSEVTNMNGMFASAEEFNGDIGGWDVSQVIDMGNMFQLATKFNRDLGGWNLSKLGQGSFGPFHLNDISFFDSGMDCDNYGATLKGWSENINTSTDVTFSAKGIRYKSEDSGYRDILINDFNWTISGDSVGGCDLSTENMEISDFTVYPNPAQDQFTITGLSGNETIQLMDMTGRLLITVKNNGNDSSTLQIDELSEGIYNLVIQENGNQTVKKVVKQ